MRTRRPVMTKEGQVARRPVNSASNPQARTTQTNSLARPMQRKTKPEAEG